MTESSADRISWLAVTERLPVFGAAGGEIGYTAKVLGDTSNGRFDGIVLGVDERFKRDPELVIEVDQIEDLKEDGVYTILTDEDIATLKPYERQIAMSAKGKKGRLSWKSKK